MIIVTATFAAIVAIGIMIWFNVRQVPPPGSIGATGSPQHYNTTGGQEMRPRWNSGEGQTDDTAGN
jgi:hypothetical protein